MSPSAIQETTTNQGKRSALPQQASTFAPSARPFERTAATTRTLHSLAKRRGAPRIPAPPGMAVTRRESIDAVGSAPLDSCASVETASGTFWYRAEDVGATVLFCESQARMLSFPPALGGVPVIAIAANACSDLTAVEVVELPASLRVIGPHAFARCVHLASIRIGHKLESIEEGAFRGCRSLERIDLPGSLRRIGDSAFSCTALRSVFLPASCTNLGPDALCTGPSFPGSAGLPYASTLQSIAVDAANPRFRVTGGVLCERRGDGKLTAILCTGKAGNVELGKDVARVEAGAFAGTTAIESLRVHESVALPADSPLLPNRSCDRITVDFTAPDGSGASLSLELPEGALRERILAQATCGTRIRPEVLARAYDSSLPQVEDAFARIRLMVSRLARPLFLETDACERFRTEADGALTNVCVHAGGRNDWQTLDDLMDAGILSLERIADAVSALNRFGFALAAAHVLDAKQKRFGGAYADYAL